MVTCLKIFCYQKAMVYICFHKIGGLRMPTYSIFYFDQKDRKIGLHRECNREVSSPKASRVKHYSPARHRPRLALFSHWLKPARLTPPSTTYNYIYNVHDLIIYISAEFATIHGNWKFVVLTLHWPRELV